jgi:hypothetical protein
MADINHTPPAAAPSEDITRKLGSICMREVTTSSRSLAW